MSHTDAGQTFGTALKGWHGPCQKEASVFTRECEPHEMPCTMTHWWSGGTFENYTGTRVRYYVDGAATALDIPLGLGWGSAPDWLGGYEDNGPWSAGALFGKSGVGLHAGGAAHGSGLWNNIQVPFGSKINVTVALGCNYSAEYFWLILRGRTKATVVLPGAQVEIATGRGCKLILCSWCPGTASATGTSAELREQRCESIAVWLPAILQF